MAIFLSHHFMANRRGKVEAVIGFIFLDSKVTSDGDCRHEIKRHMLLGRKARTNLDTVLKRSAIILWTKVCIIKAMVFQVVIYGCESWTMKKNEHKIIDAFKLWSWRRLLRVPWTASGSNQSILIPMNFHWKDWCWNWNSNTLATWHEEPDHWKRPWCWERLKAKEDECGRG